MTGKATPFFVSILPGGATLPTRKEIAGSAARKTKKKKMNFLELSLLLTLFMVIFPFSKFFNFFFFSNNKVYTYSLENFKPSKHRIKFSNSRKLVFPFLFFNNSNAESKACQFLFLLLFMNIYIIKFSLTLRNLFNFSNLFLGYKF